MDAEIREATTDDIDRLVALSRKTIADCYSKFLGESAVAGYLDSGAVDQYVADNIQRCVVIVGGGTVAGYSVTKASLIDLMMVETGFHGRGFGTRLLAHVEDILFRHYDVLSLESFKDNLPANVFYRNRGWVEVRTFADDESNVDKVEFRKSRAGRSMTDASG